MNKVLIRIFWPVLKIFETGEAPKNYKKSHRVILVVVGAMFTGLALVSASAVYFSGSMGGLIPVIVFFCVGFVAVVVGVLGSDGAVSKIWGSK